MTGIVTPIRIGRRRVVFVLGTIAALLLTAHVSLLAVTAITGHDSILGLVGLFDLDEENNLPSFFSGGLLLLNGALFWLVARLPAFRTRSHVWSVLGVVFVLLAYDELFGVHELLTRPIREALRTTGLLHYPWMIAYALPVAGLAIWFLPTWRSLEAAARTRLVVAGVLYLLGAVVMEMIGGAYEAAFGRAWPLGSGLLVGVEESLEMAGLIALVHALLALLAPSGGGAPFVFHDERSPARTGPTGPDL